MCRNRERNKIDPQRLVFRCGYAVFERKYLHDYARIYGKETKTKGPLNQGLTG
jgi:hypothetical protein